MNFNIYPMDVPDLLRSISEGDLSKLRELIQQELSVKKKYKLKLIEDAVASHISPLGMAVYYDQPKVVELFLNSGSKVDSIETLKYTFSEQTMTPLCIACRNAKSSADQIISLLLHAGAEVDVSMFLKHSELEEEGGYTTYTDSFNKENEYFRIETPMIWLINRNKLNLMDAMLNGGADPLYVFTNRGHSPYDTNDYLIGAITSFSSVDCVKKLLSAGGIVPEPEDIPPSILYYIYIAMQSAIDESYFLEVLKLLLETDFPFSICQPVLHMYLLYAFPTLKTDFNANSMDISIVDTLSEDNRHQKHCKQLIRQFCCQFETFNVIWDVNQYQHNEITLFFELFYMNSISPKSLKNQCRITIRKCIGRIKLVPKVSTLALPQSLENYLLYY